MISYVIEVNIAGSLPRPLNRPHYGFLRKSQLNAGQYFSGTKFLPFSEAWSS
jgi:hypothetical protein